MVTISPSFILYKMVVLPAASVVDHTSVDKGAVCARGGLLRRFGHTQAYHKDTDVHLPKQSFEDVRNC